MQTEFTDDQQKKNNFLPKIQIQCRLNVKMTDEVCEPFPN